MKKCMFSARVPQKKALAVAHDDHHRNFNKNTRCPSSNHMKSQQEKREKKAGRRRSRENTIKTGYIFNHLIFQYQSCTHNPSNPFQPFHPQEKLPPIHQLPCLTTGADCISFQSHPHHPHHHLQCQVPLTWALNFLGLPMKLTYPIHELHTKIISNKIFRLEELTLSYISLIMMVTEIQLGS